MVGEGKCQDPACCYLEVPGLRRSVDRSGDDVSSIGRQLDAVDTDLLGGQHDVGDGRTLTGRRRRPVRASVELHVAHLERRRRRRRRIVTRTAWHKPAKFK